MTRGIVDLPIEVLRRIIQNLLYNPVEPTRFRKSNLLPLASTCRHLRDASIEFLFWSVDLFEASFGLQHRVLKSNVALERFHNLIAYPVGYLRGGVRRFLVRDRDRTASIDLWRVLEKFESLRSLHLDGPFGPETFPLAPQSLLEYPENIRLYTTLVNLTFIACKASSPLFPFFLQSGVFVNLTRLYYQDDNEEMDGWKKPRSKSQNLPSAFAQLVPETKPVFPYLSTVVIKVAPIPNDRLRHILHFLEVHSASLQRLSVYMGVAPGSSSFMWFTFSNTPDYEHTESTALLWETIKECTALLWKTVERLTNLRVLCVDISCAKKSCAPESVIHLTHLQGVYVHTNSSFISIDKTKKNEAHPVCIPFPSFR
ncbi:hypothetical protein CPB86DRAFT_761575 [Serendipita vermifera]|nr:hypothetical protein CPB86DRAFT_761575 [Serendipita vermifera]